MTRYVIFCMLLAFFCGQIYAQKECFAPLPSNEELAVKNQAELMEYFEELMDSLEELVGCEAPNFTAQTLEGESVDLYSLRGKIVVLNFWFIACPPCRAEMPGLKQISDEFSGREDVVLLALSTDDKPALDKFQGDHEIGFTIIPNAREIAREYRVLGFPTTMVLDKEGKVSTVFSGGTTKEKQATRLFYKEVKRGIQKNS